MAQKEALTKAQAITKANDNKISHIHEYITTGYENNTDDLLVKDYIVEKVLMNISDFGGSCSVIDKDDTCGSHNKSSWPYQDSASHPFEPSSITREGFRLSACNRLVSIDRAVSNAVYNIKSDRNLSFDKSHIAKTYKLFYPDADIDSQELAALTKLTDIVTLTQTSQLDVWRALLLSICHTSGWQIP